MNKTDEEFVEVVKKEIEEGLTDYGCRTYTVKKLLSIIDELRKENETLRVNLGQMEHNADRQNEIIDCLNKAIEKKDRALELADKVLKKCNEWGEISINGKKLNIEDIDEALTAIQEARK